MYRCDRLLMRRTRNRIRPHARDGRATFVLLPAAVFMPCCTRRFATSYSRRAGSSRASYDYTEVCVPFAFGFLFFALLFPAIAPPSPS